MACPHCNATENQQRRGKNNAGRQIYQCRRCLKRYVEGLTPRAPRIPREVIVCVQCGHETTNRKFCSLPCANKYNNKLGKWKKQGKQAVCKYCGKPLSHRRRTTCYDCNPNIADRLKQTIGDIQRAAKYQVSALLRHVARQTYAASGLPYVCRNCGYDKHAEICHIRAIRDFPEDTPVAVVSGLDNLVALCPNCHWEFDRGLLTIEKILTG